MEDEAVEVKIVFITHANRIKFGSILRLNYKNYNLNT